MNVQLDLRMDKPAFLAWVQGRGERCELAEGRVMMMTGGSRGHAIITRRLATALENRLDPDRWIVLTSDFGVDLGPSTVRYPDVLVDVAGEPFGDLTATAPILVAEVISPSSASDDLAEKPPEYSGCQASPFISSLHRTRRKPGFGYAAQPDFLLNLTCFAGPVKSFSLRRWASNCRSPKSTHTA